MNAKTHSADLNTTKKIDMKANKKFFFLYSVCATTILIWSILSNKPTGDQITAQQLKPAESEPRPPAMEYVPAVPDLGPAEAVSPQTNSRLEPAVRCALFVGEVQRKVPHERATTRHLLGGLQATLFINDYLMAARTEGGGELEISKAAINEAFRSAGTNVTYLTKNLATYSSIPESMPEHYARVENNPAAKESFAAIRNAVESSGAKVDSNNDMLLDCQRFAAFSTSVREMYGPFENPLEGDMPNPAEAAALRDSFSKVFAYRFENRYGLSSNAAANLVQLLSSIRLNEISPADLEVPAKLQ